MKMNSDNYFKRSVAINLDMCFFFCFFFTFQEDFLDLTITVAGNSSLEDGLCASYLDMESLDGKNQYKCEQCNKLVNAKKVSISSTSPASTKY